jgi:hypothetical protein
MTTTHGQSEGIELRCRQCGYDLRGLGSDDRCPECGADVGPAIVAAKSAALGEPAPLAGGNTRWLRNIAWGYTAVAVATMLWIALGGFIVLDIDRQWDFLPPIVSLGVDGLVFLLLMVGTFLASSAEPYARRTWGELLSRLLARVGLIVVLGVNVVGMVHDILNTIIAIPPVGQPPRFVLWQVAHFAAAVPTMALLGLAARLARRADLIGAARLARIAQWVVPVVCGAVAVAPQEWTTLQAGSYFVRLSVLPIAGDLYAVPSVVVAAFVWRLNLAITLVVVIAAAGTTVMQCWIWATLARHTHMASSRP